MDLEIHNRKFKIGNIEHELRSPELDQLEVINDEWFHLLTKMNTVLFCITEFSINGNTFQTPQEIQNHLKTIS